MRLAVTGATGFIGRHVIQDLCRRNIYPVVVMHPKDVGSSWVSGLEKVTVDLQDPNISVRLFSELGRPDLLIHLAWGGLPNYKSDYHIKQELPAQKRFLTAMIESGLPSLAISGTCSEYGKQSGELCETMESYPDNPYGMAKNELRVYLEDLQKKHPFSLTWCRFFYLYGEGQSSRSLFSLLKAAVQRGESSFDMSGGEQVRDFMPVEEAAEDFVSLALMNKNVGVVNICSGQPISIKKLVGKWITENNWKIDLNFGVYPYPDYESMEFWGCRERLNSLLKKR